MKVFTRIEELLGEKPYVDKRLEALAKRFSITKITYYSVEFTSEPKNYECIVVPEEELLDLIVEDLEKAESLDVENPALKKALEVLSSGKVLSEELPPQDLSSLKEFSFFSAHPIVIFQEDKDTLFAEIFQKTSSIFFFTTVKEEARAWRIKKGTDIVSAAAKIHTDLAKGFIRAEVYNVKDLEQFKNL